MPRSYCLNRYILVGRQLDSNTIEFTKKILPNQLYPALYVQHVIVVSDALQCKLSRDSTTFPQVPHHFRLFFNIYMVVIIFNFQLNHRT